MTVQNRVSILGFPPHAWFSHRSRFSLATRPHDAIEGPSIVVLYCSVPSVLSS